MAAAKRSGGEAGEQNHAESEVAGIPRTIPDRERALASGNRA